MSELQRVAPPYDPPAPEHLVTLAETSDLLIINKPSGLLSVPGRGAEKAICAQSIAEARHGPALIVHRLDMDTSGLMVLARNKPAQKALSGLFQTRRVAKTYEAIVAGRVEQDAGEIDLPIAKFSRQRPLRHTCPDGQPALTRWNVITRDGNSTRLELVPVTGRSHQLRLHLSEIGHPILGDAFYGDAHAAPRLLLHARSIAFPDPVSGLEQRFDCAPAF